MLKIAGPRITLGAQQDAPSARRRVPYTAGTYYTPGVKPASSWASPRHASRPKSGGLGASTPSSQLPLMLEPTAPAPPRPPSPPHPHPTILPEPPNWAPAREAGRPLPLATGSGNICGERERGWARVPGWAPLPATGNRAQLKTPRGDAGWPPCSVRLWILVTSSSPTRAEFTSKIRLENHSAVSGPE